MDGASRRRRFRERHPREGDGDPTAMAPTLRARGFTLTKGRPGGHRELRPALGSFRNHASDAPDLLEHGSVLMDVKATCSPPDDHREGVESTFQHGQACKVSPAGSLSRGNHRNTKRRHRPASRQVRLWIISSDSTSAEAIQLRPSDPRKECRQLDFATDGWKTAPAAFGYGNVVFRTDGARCGASTRFSTRAGNSKSSRRTALPRSACR